jgi:uncharacterized protein
MAKRHQTEREFTFYHYMIDLMGGPCIVKRISGCGVGTEYLAVTATGDLYPCHQFVGIPQFLLGNLDTGIVNHKIREQFSACNVYSHKECQDCFARLFFAVVVVPPMPSMLPEISQVSMSWAANYIKNVSNVPSCSK